MPRGPTVRSLRLGRAAPPPPHLLDPGVGVQNYPPGKILVQEGANSAVERQWWLFGLSEDKEEDTPCSISHDVQTAGEEGWTVVVTSPGIVQTGRILMHREFWAKADETDGGQVTYHPLIGHALDVAAVATVLTGPQGFRMAPSTLAFLIALHDVGKLSRPPFQAKVPYLWPSALGAYPATRPPPAGPRHDAVGFMLLRDVLDEQLDPFLPSGAGGWRPRPADAPLYRPGRSSRQTAAGTRLGVER